MTIFSKRGRKFSARILLLAMLCEMGSLPAAMALTGGPSQPESRAFEPVGTTEMVDLFTGDFTYNIPLFELPGPNGGYPFNLAYHAGIGLDDEASWTGLGWNLNPGAINRQMRGLPDEFDGDSLYTTMSIAPNVTASVGFGVNVEVLGLSKDFTSLGMSFYNNNYTGLGYSIDASLGAENAFGSGMTAQLRLSLDNQQGISASPSLDVIGKKMGGIGLGAEYNSKSGLHAISWQISSPQERNGKNGSETTETNTFRSSSSASLSLAQIGYTPQIGLPMKHTSLSFRYKTGASFLTVFSNAYVTGQYNESRLENDKIRMPVRAYGYQNFQNIDRRGDFVSDINREKDGVVSREAPNLGIPFLTYDIYSVSGQGISGMFRPYRNDFGIVTNAEVKSKTSSAGAGLDGAFKKAGINLDILIAQSESGSWTGNNQIENSGLMGFKHRMTDDIYEPWYYKLHGESGVNPNGKFDAVGGDDAVRYKLVGFGSQVSATPQLETDARNISNLSGRQHAPERRVRNKDIIPISNSEILGDTSTLYKSFDISYYNSSGDTVSLDRMDRSLYPDHHWAGYMAVTEEGLRYNYALPAYNREHEEIAFSTQNPVGNRAIVNGNNGLPGYEVNNTDKYLKKTEIPDYAHSYLLTSVLGPDYVDVTGDGLTEDDLGYWVKFTYKQITAGGSGGENLYAWRDPFFGAHLMEGFRTDAADDKGTFTYGKKEIWYLAMAETKTHIAEFSLSDRKDGRPPASKLQDTPGKGTIALKKLDEIKLYTRAGGRTNPIKKVKFEYTYGLCQGIPNYQGESGEPSLDNGGKLTLKKLWFEYGKSQRGSLNPYEFDYNNENDSGYEYEVGALDRWGTYRPHKQNDPLYNQDIPYTSQNPNGKEDLDNNAAAWSLNQIRLPSGGMVRVDYESDDYAFVQHKQAMAMVQIADAGGTYPAGENAAFDLTDYQVMPGNSGAKIRFPLRNPVPAPTGEEDSAQLEANKNEVLKYLDTHTWQLFFRIYVNLRKQGEDFFEFVEGYADIEREGTMGLERSGPGGQSYTHGFFHVKKERGHHPFVFYTWQHLKINQPNLANIGKKLEPVSGASAKIKQVRGLTGIVPQIRQVIRGFDAYCDDKGWGKIVDPERSTIRLKSPDKNKFGGGLRVKQITMSDNWQYDSEGIYGQYFEYRKMEDGESISSGVAAYEPLVGGEENALRYAKRFTNRIPLKADNNLYFEYPINESYYPGPQVGYSRVTVMSLVSAYKTGKPVLNLDVADGESSVPLLPVFASAEYGTTGATVHEFYTAREFPTMASETAKIDREHNSSVNFLFFGSMSENYLTSSQGYMVTTNDMHGRPKWTGQYGQKQSGDILTEPFNWVKYNYFTRTTVYEGEKVFETVNAFAGDGDGRLEAIDVLSGSSGSFSLGRDVEFITDVRENRDQTFTAGPNFNIDMVWIIPIPSIWKNVGHTDKRLRTVVTNKVIFTPGVISSIEAYNEGSFLHTENLKWDAQTGIPVLTSVNNNFDNPVYTLQFPAFRQYPGMGASYKNSGFQFSMVGVRNYRNEAGYYVFDGNEASMSRLTAGDELMLFTSAGGLLQPVSGATYLGERDGERLFYSDNPLNLHDDLLTAKILRSGNRNHLQTNAGSITALQIPLAGDFLQFQVPVKLPKGKMLD